MQKNKINVDSKKRLAEAHAMLDEAFKAQNPWFKMTIDKKKRLNIQNSLQFHWYRELEGQGLGTRNEIRMQCKYSFGVPLLMQQDDDFKEYWFKLFDHLDYEIKVASMQYVDVTSKLTIDNMSRYLDSIKHHYTANGYTLTNRNHR